MTKKKPTTAFKRGQTCGSYDLSFGASGVGFFYRPTRRKWKVVKRYGGRVTLQSGRTVFEARAVRVLHGDLEYVDVRGQDVGSHRVVPYVPNHR